VSDEIFVNEVDTSIPLLGFETSDATLGSWVTTAGGAVFCRASRSTDVRPGDSSWAFKPANDLSFDCGCNSGGWTGQGAFYGGVLMPTFCAEFGGGWAGVSDNGGAKGGVTSADDVSIWVR
jgi:hypothetical protein